MYQNYRMFSKKYFLIEYDYVEDAYYKRSKFYYWSLRDLIVPHREQHLKLVQDQLKQSHQTKVLGAPFFPYDGATMLIETEGDRSHIE